MDVDRDRTGRQFLGSVVFLIVVVIATLLFGLWTIYSLMGNALPNQ